MVVADLGVGEAFPEIGARIVGDEVGGRFEIGDRHFVFADQVEADAAAVVGVGKAVLSSGGWSQLDGVGEGADGGAELAEHAFGDAAAEERGGEQLARAADSFHRVA